MITLGSEWVKAESPRLDKQPVKAHVLVSENPNITGGVIAKTPILLTLGSCGRKTAGSQLLLYVQHCFHPEAEKSFIWCILGTNSQGATKPLSACLEQVSSSAGQAGLPDNLPARQVTLNPRL